MDEPTQVIGLSLLPLDGDPNKAMGLIAHPGAVAALAVSHDGRRLLSVGGSDSVINMWAVDAAALEASIPSPSRVRAEVRVRVRVWVWVCLG